MRGIGSLRAALGAGWSRLRGLGGLGSVERSNRAARIMVDGFDSEFGLGLGSSGVGYADYYSKSSAVNAAVRVRAEAVSRPSLRVMIRELGGEGGYRVAGADDPLQRMLDRPNGVWSPGELLRVTETFLSLWGSAYWGIERDESGGVSELWPLRPDRVRVVPDRDRYVKGFVYEHQGERVGYLAEEVVWFRQVNPLDEFGGMSCVPPARLAVDMGYEALQYNRDFFRNSALPGDLVITSKGTPTDEEISEFYARWESRFRGAGKGHRPVLLSGGLEASRLGISHRDMEFVEVLRWPVEEVSRAFGVPKVFLGHLEDATLSNVSTFERFFWRNTIVPELRLIEEAVTRSVAPLFAGVGVERRVEFDVSEIEALKESENDRVERQVKLVGAGVLSVDEVRAEHNLGPLGG